MQQERQYIAIDLKSFYASVECVERRLDPLDACLVVADNRRTDKTICLAVSPALKAFGVPGRPRLFEVVRRVREVNNTRGRCGCSTSGLVLASRPDIALDYIVAPPRMRLYNEYSEQIRNIYLRHIAPEDMHVYSIDEVFINVTPYLKHYHMTPHEIAMLLIRDVLAETGITATVGIGSNIYLSKVAMDILAKKMPPDANGVRIASLTPQSYQQLLWDHTPLTDFWYIGHATARHLQTLGLNTMADIATYSQHHSDILYNHFGIQARSIIEHAWGEESTSMENIKEYRPVTQSMSSGQVLCEPYTPDRARIVAQEMADNLAYKLLEAQLLTNQLVLTIDYDTTSITNPAIAANYHGPVFTDHYGRPVPQHSHGSVNLRRYTSSGRLLIDNIRQLYDRIVNPALLIRRLTIATTNLRPDTPGSLQPQPLQLDIFTDYQEVARQHQQLETSLVRERRRREAILRLRQQFGKNSVITGLNLAPGATQLQRNQQIGGHSA